MLKAEGITKTYRGKTVLKNAGFTLQNGQCLGIAGHNGSGKSTLLSIVAGVLPPDAGSLECDSHPVLGNRDFTRTMLGYIPQKDGLLPDLTVLETLRFWQKTYGLGGGLFSPGGPCAMLGLEAIAGQRVGRLSGGMQKRLSVALALLHAPQYLLMDEALAALDLHYRTALLQWLGPYRRNGAAVLYCSHELSELRSFCDSILVLREGEIVFYDRTDKFPTDPDLLDALMNPVQPAHHPRERRRKTDVL